ncbi:NUDIX domain-containing protein [Eubacteriales bacterium OttesenSCG-928-M02]|nr:NUDIX domain-containing protein [Eubacteriales bacterium OttesenSCG-928-M02]
MAIRSSIKALIQDEAGNVLLNEYRMKNGALSYMLPGGGQRQHESMADALLRECLEETGYTIRMEGLVAVHEEISLDAHFRHIYPGYSHKIHHIFRCTLLDVPQKPPTEWDVGQVGTRWVSPSELPSIPLLPTLVKHALPALFTADAPQFLGTEYTERWVR